MEGRSVNANAEVIGGILGAVATALFPPWWVVALSLCGSAALFGLAIYGALHLVGVVA